MRLRDALDALSKPALVVMFVLVLVGVSNFFLALASDMSGVPHHQVGNAICPYYVRNHQTVECISRARYESAVARQQRLFAGVLGAFFVFQFGLAANELKRRRLDRAEHV